MQRDELVYAYFDTRTHRELVSRWKNWVFARPGEDWQGGHHTYAGHTGTDFLLPVGTAVLAMASGYLTHQC
jgi:murein DD-endopeptidase MepM/ murein hydrolase activator NlpD